MSRSVCRRRLRRGASLYLTVFSSALIVSLLGLAGVTANRVERKIVQSTNHRLAARSYSRSAVELALRALADDPQWRDNYVSGVETTPQLLDVTGVGTVSWIIKDADGSLATPDTDLRLLGVGRMGNTVQVSTVSLTANAPLPVLGMSVHASGKVRINEDRWLTVEGAPVSSNNRVVNDGTLDGNVHAVDFENDESFYGTDYSPQPAKQMPSASVFDDYIAIATTLPYNGSIDKHVLGPQRNEYGGGLSPQGVYYINTSGNDLVIKNSRVHGTLVVDAGSKMVIIDNTTFMHTYQAQYPVLMVRGTGDDVLEIKITSQGSLDKRYLQESAQGHNFNPAAAEYLGVWDNDTRDSYPSELHGLVYTTGGDVTLDETCVIRGALIADDGEITIEGGGEESVGPQIVHDPGLLTSPPIGFMTDSNEVKVVPRSWIHGLAP